MVRRQDNVDTEGCPSACVCASTSQIVLEITECATLAGREYCFKVLSVDKIHFRCAAG